MWWVLWFVSAWAVIRECLELNQLNRKEIRSLDLSEPSCTSGLAVFLVVVCLLGSLAHRRRIFSTLTDRNSGSRNQGMMLFWVKTAFKSSGHLAKNGCSSGFVDIFPHSSVTEESLSQELICCHDINCSCHCLWISCSMLGLPCLSSVSITRIKFRLASRAHRNSIWQNLLSVMPSVRKINTFREYDTPLHMPLTVGSLRRRRSHHESKLTLHVSVIICFEAIKFPSTSKQSYPITWICRYPIPINFKWQQSHLPSKLVAIFPAPQPLSPSACSMSNQKEAPRNRSDTARRRFCTASWALDCLWPGTTSSKGETPSSTILRNNKQYYIILNNINIYKTFTKQYTIPSNIIIS